MNNIEEVEIYELLDENSDVCDFRIAEKLNEIIRLVNYLNSKDKKVEDKSKT